MERPTQAAVSELMKRAELPPGFDCAGETEATDFGALVAAAHISGSADGFDYLERVSPGRPDAPALEYRLGYLVGGFLARVVGEPERIQACAATFGERLGSHMGFSLEQGMEGWIAANPDHAEDLLAVVEETASTLYLVPKLLAAIRAIRPAEAFSTALRLLSDTRSTIRHRAAAALATFELDEGSEWPAVQARLIELLGSDERSDLSGAIWAIGRQLARFGTASPEVEEGFEALAARATPEIRHDLISGLTGRANRVSTRLTELYVGLLETLRVNVGEELLLLNRWLYEVDHTDERSTIFSVLTKVMQNSGAEATFGGLHSFPRPGRTNHDIAWYVFSWLLEGTHAVRDQLHGLFPPLDQSLRNFSTGGLVLSDADILYLARKVFAYFLLAHGPAVSLLAALLVAAEGDAKLDLENEIAGFWLRNFSGDLELFEEIDKAYPERKLTVSIRRMRKTCKQYTDPLDALPPNPAMRPSTMERRVQIEMARLRNTKIRGMADRASVLASLVTRSTILYGRSAVSHIERGEGLEPIRQVVPFQHFSTSMTMPSMDVLAPAYLQHLIWGYRGEERPE